MSDKKKKEKKQLSEADLIAKARKKRLALAKESATTEESTNERENFKRYFLKLNKKLKKDRSLEEVIWTHLKTIKHDKEELFDKGVEHFGYKI